MLHFKDDWDHAALERTEPTPGRFYRIQYGKGGLLTTTGRAYRVSAKDDRRRLAKKINEHPYNRRFWRPTRNAWERNHFPEGLIAFNPNFAKSFGDQSKTRGVAPSGRSFAVIWIPRRSDPVYLMGAAGTVYPSPLARPNGLGKRWRQMTCTPETNVRADCRGAPEPVEPVDVSAPPFRWICKIITMRRLSGTNEYHIGGGTGALVGRHLVLTCGHVLRNYIAVPDKRDDTICASVEIVEPDYIFVIPGKRNAVEEPFGAFGIDLSVAREKKIRTPKEWHMQLKKKLGKARRRCVIGKKFDVDVAAPFDLGMIDLRSAARFGPARLGRHFGKPFILDARGRPVITFLSEPEGRLRIGQTVHVGGYPSDRPCTPTRSDGRIDNLNRTMGGVRASLASGNSGSPVWTWRKSSNGTPILHMVGIYTSHVPGSGFCGRFVRLSRAKKTLSELRASLRR
ncbi:trypsin-like serine peptidase [Aestuariibius sp. 2305UL40-4]|uniref:trypsin-like serine peptidase n=1 Tax=Aestuariibius violaceus TaxID=3234132 RepID=UPI00346B04A9